MILIVEDRDAAFRRAAAAGAVVVCPVSDQRYGLRVGRMVIHMVIIGKLASH
jgi:uncharacterized glyoxalase superfamily protein PhnB